MSAPYLGPVYQGGLTVSAAEARMASVRQAHAAGHLTTAEAKAAIAETAARASCACVCRGTGQCHACSVDAMAAAFLPAAAICAEAMLVVARYVRRSFRRRPSLRWALASWRWVAFGVRVWWRVVARWW